MDREQVNRILRSSFNDILNYKPIGKELARQKEIDEIARQEKEEYEKKKADFYNNPLHWNNNKRRRCGLPVLRGNVNKYRSKRYPSFHPTARLMCMIEDTIDEVLTDGFKNNKFFQKFVDIKDLDIGDSNTYYVSDYEEQYKEVLDEYFREPKYSGIKQIIDEVKTVNHTDAILIANTGEQAKMFERMLPGVKVLCANGHLGSDDKVYILPCEEKPIKFTWE